MLIDRFNYLKIIDEQSYVRVDSDTLKEYKEVINIKIPIIYVYSLIMEIFIRLK